MTVPARVLAALVLVGVWCALWGEVTIANVLSGLAVAAVIGASTTGVGGRGQVRLRPLAQFLALVFVDLVESTVAVARQVLTPGYSTEEAIVAVPVPPVSTSHLLMLVVAVTVTPGTAVVDADQDTGTLYLHLLDDARAEATALHVDRLASLARQTLPRNTEFNPSDQTDVVES